MPSLGSDDWLRLLSMLTDMGLEIRWASREQGLITVSVPPVREVGR